MNKEFLWTAALVMTLIGSSMTNAKAATCSIDTAELNTPNFYCPNNPTTCQIPTAPPGTQNAGGPITCYGVSVTSACNLTATCAGAKTSLDIAYSNCASSIYFEANDMKLKCVP